jgi:hypothetical protein
VKVADLEEAQRLVEQHAEITRRLGTLARRDQSWLECMGASAGSKPLFGNEDLRLGRTELDLSADYLETASKLADLIEQYLSREKARVEQALKDLGVELNGQV